MSQNIDSEVPFVVYRRAKNHWVQGVVNTVVLAWVWSVFLPRTTALSEFPVLIHMRYPLHSKPLWWLSADWHAISPFEILSAFTVHGLPLQSSFSRNSGPILKLLYQTHTAIFLKSIIPINSLQVLHCLCSTLPHLAHELFTKSETFAMKAGTHYHLSSSSTWQTSSNVQLLPTHAYKGNRQHILQQHCHITTHLNTSLHFWEHLIPLHTDRTCKWTIGAEICSSLNRGKPTDHSKTLQI